MSRVARYGKAVAGPGNGDSLAQILLAAAGDLADDPGCELYLVNRQAGEPDVIWVTELWRSQADLERVAEAAGDGDDVAAVMTMMRDFAVIELDHLGGKGP